MYQFTRTTTWLLSLMFALSWLTACSTPDQDSDAAQHSVSQISGELTYQPRIALPPQAVARIRLMEADTGLPLVALEIPLRGKQVPVPFQFDVDTALIVDEQEYVVIGSILIGERTAWSTPVIAVEPGHGDIDLGTLNLAQSDRAPDTGEDPGADDNHFRATGNEPGWRLDMSGDSISLSLQYGDTVLEGDRPASEKTDGSKHYALELSGRWIQIDIQDALCRDTMTGMPHPYTVALQVDDEHLQGCGGEPSSLLQGVWQVRQIGEDAPVDDSAPTVQFDAHGNVAGNAGCNAYSGRYLLSGEGLSIDELISTLMACADPLMAQERQVLAILEQTYRFDINDAGQLVLHDNTSRTLTAEQ